MKSANGPIVYSVREIKNIVHIFDPPILLVNVRNLLAYHQAAFTRKGMNFMADWEDIHFWSEMTKETKLKYAELIDFKTKHLVKTSFASKIFSRSVSKGICDAILKGNYLITNACLYFTL